MTAKRKTRIATPQTRDPKPKQRKPPEPRRYIAASMPTVCPVCGRSTRMSDGRHIDPVRKTILEYRTCVGVNCGERLAAGRPMTAREIEKYCTHVDAVKDYQQSPNK